MDTPLIVPGVRDMAHDLAPHLRAADAGELRANGRQPLEGLLRCCDVSAQLSAITLGARPLALFGFADLGEGTGCPWLLGSDELVTDHRVWFLRHTPEIVSSGDHRWTRFWNRVDARNSLHVRWLRWAGFTVDPPAPHGPYGLPFHPIHRTTAVCAT